MKWEQNIFVMFVKESKNLIYDIGVGDTNMEMFDF